MTTYLLDTHILLWAVANERLPAAAAAIVEDHANTVLFSALSIAETAIKYAKGSPDFDVDPGLLQRTLLNDGYVELPLTSEHAVAMRDLPPIHKDPFDRMLLAQARAEGINW